MDTTSDDSLKDMLSLMQGYFKDSDLKVLSIEKGKDLLDIPLITPYNRGVGVIEEWGCTAQRYGLFLCPTSCV